MEKKLDEIRRNFLLRLKSVDKSELLFQVWQDFFGSAGHFTQTIKTLKNFPTEKRPELGRLINSIKKELTEEFEKRKKELTEKKLFQWLDVTMPGKTPKIGHLHPVSQAIEEITQIFERIGFSRKRYPEVEWEWYAFEVLNMPAGHPARDDFETFFLAVPSHPFLGKLVLSPHTSSGQVREMEEVGKPPIRMLNIAKCYRPNWDISHTPMFHQFEGLVVDEGINLTHLKGTLEYFAREFFGPERKIRFRPFHFQFTEPSFEIDISCGLCQGKGCRFCKEGWLELAGAGMVHPKVLEAGKIDPKKFSGYAFGAGVERTYLMKEGLQIDDLRLLYENDLRFLAQF